MADKTGVADVAALTQRLGADEVGVGERAVVDDIRVTAHRAELHQVALAEYLRIDTFVALKMEYVIRIILVLCVAPAESRAFLEAEGHDLLHQREEEG